MPVYAIPLGALLAAERAYAELDDEQLAQPALVAERLLQAAAPFVGPIAAQLGYGRISAEASTDILRDHLKGISTKQLADTYAVSTRTIQVHIRRRLRYELARSRAGVPVARIARQLGCPTTVIASELEREIRREQKASPDSEPSAAELSVWLDDQSGAVVRKRRRSDSGRRRPRSGGLPGNSGEPGGIRDQVD